jgi:hypothetical protein
VSTPSATATTSYRERLHAPVWLWVVALVLALVLGVAYGWRLGTGPGVAAFLVSAVIVVAVLLVTTTVVAVEDRAFRAGRARLPLSAVGRVAVLDPERTREVRGPRADPRAYLCMRGWVPWSVLVEVDDPDDPHPYWLVSTRRPRDLAPLLAAARDRARAGADDVAG